MWLAVAMSTMTMTDTDGFMYFSVVSVAEAREENKAEVGTLVLKALVMLLLGVYRLYWH